MAKVLNVGSSKCTLLQVGSEVVEAAEVEDTAEMLLRTSNWASVWANQTLGLSAQNSGSLMAIAFGSKVSVKASVECSNIVEATNRC